MLSILVTITDDSGEGTLRWAIENANALAGEDTIEFNIPGEGVHTIQPLSALPAITDAVVIDGTTQPGYAGSPIIELDGSAAEASGLTIAAGNSVVRGLVINRFDGSGVFLQGGSQNRIQGNFIGTDVTGTKDLGNREGIYILGSERNFIGTDGDGAGDDAEGNVLSGNAFAGVTIWGAAAIENVLAGNFIGTDKTGNARLANDYGVFIGGYAQWNRIGTNADGLADRAERNVISGNNCDGVQIAGPSGADYNTVAGNLIGTDGTGTLELGNMGNGVYILGRHTGNVIGTDGDGDDDVAERNVISGNRNSGVYIYEGSENVVAGNYIGTDITGAHALGNYCMGVYLGAAHANRVGTNGDGVGDTAERNVIAGSVYAGVTFEYGALENVVAGNYIGTDVSGSVALPNTNGVYIGMASTGNVIGTNGDGKGDGAEGNVISGNLQTGIVIGDAACGNVVAGNFIGTDPTGTVALPNGWYGIYLGDARSNVVGTDGDGLSDSSEGNLISGNGVGVFITGAETIGNVVAGNYIGTDVTGTVALGNAVGGVIIAQGSNQIGGVAPLANTIAFNGGAGVSILGSGQPADQPADQPAWIPSGVPWGGGTSLQFDGGNDFAMRSDSPTLHSDRQLTVSAWFKVNSFDKEWQAILVKADQPDWENNWGNREYGVWVRSDGALHFVSTPVDLGSQGQLWLLTEPSVIACDQWYYFAAVVDADASSPIMQLFVNGELKASGDYDASGIRDTTGPLGIGFNPSVSAGLNGALDELSIWGVARSQGEIQQDMTGPLAGNEPGLLAYWNFDEASGATASDRTAHGNDVALGSPPRLGSRIQANSIHSNGGLGIDLGNDGVTTNDPGDADAGPNYLQNFPVLTTVEAGPATRVQGTLNSLADRTFTLDFYANTEPDPSGYGEGERWLGSATVTTNSSGDATFDVLLAGATTASEVVTATATDAGGNTSEFSGVVIVNPPAPAEVSGMVFDDLDNDGTRDAGEPALARWTVFLDENRNGVLDSGEPSRLTGADGGYAFTGLSPGTYSVAQVLQAGWRQTYPSVGRLLQTLHSPAPSAWDWFGHSVAAVGSNILVGAPADDTDGSNVGAAYLFDGSTGALLRVFHNPTPTPNDWFGTYVAAMGNNVLIGNNDDGGAAADAAVVYLLDGATGDVLQTFVDPNLAFADGFGISIAAVGNNVFIGAMYDDTGTTSAGEAYLFDGTTGQLLRTFINPTPGWDDWFGTAVVPFGQNVLICAPGDGTYGWLTGQVYLYDVSTGDVLRTFTNPTPEPGDQFGVTIAVSGNNVLIAAPCDDTLAYNAGAVYLFNGSTGELLRTFLNPRPLPGGFASSLAFVGDKALIGGTEGEGPSGPGAAYLFDIGTGELLQTYLSPSPHLGDHFGYPVAGLDGKVVIGARFDDTGGADTGAVYIYGAPNAHVVTLGAGQVVEGIDFGNLRKTPPIANAGGPYAGTEGSSVQFDTSASSDPDGDPLQYRWDFESDGTWDTDWSTSPRASHTWADDWTGSVTVEVTDGDLSATDIAMVTVNNVAPTAAITGAPESSPEGTPISLTGSAIDPSSVDTTAGFTFAWAVTKNAVLYASGSGSSFSFTPDDNATYVVNLSATDRDGGTGTQNKTIEVTNVAPTVKIIGAQTIPEGTTINLSSIVSDPGSADTFTYAWSATKDGAEYASGSDATFSFTPDDNGTYEVTLTVIDDHGSQGQPATFQGVGDLPGGAFASGVADMSADGLVAAGTGSPAGHRLEAFRWTEEGGLVPLGVLPQKPAESRAAAISADGTVIVGVSEASTFNDEAFRWTEATGMVGLGYLPGGSTYSVAEDVSADGSVVVGSSLSPSGYQAFRWTEAGMVGLGDLDGGGFSSRGYGVSPDGSVVVGWGVSESGEQAFRWTAETGMIGLGDLPDGGYLSEGYGVSADGSAVAGISLSASGYEAFLWTQATGMIGLGDLPGGDFFSAAWRVTADGAVVTGQSRTELGDEAFIWDREHGMRNLRSILTADYGLDLTGWQLLTSSISADGRFLWGVGQHWGHEEGWIADLAAPAAGTDTKTIVVTNVAPLVGFEVSPHPALPGQTVSLSGAFSDAGTLDTHTAIVDWGDGTVEPAPVSETSGVGSIASSHVYVSPGAYAVSLTIRDDDGGETSVQQQIDVEPPASLQGLVWEDFNDNGLVDLGETAIEGVAITLTGTDDLGNAVLLTQTTDAQGIYEFTDLRPGTYAIKETQPSGFVDGREVLGEVPPTGTSGVIDPAEGDKFWGIILVAGSAGVNYNFGERVDGGQVVAGQTANVGFWQNKHGQALIRALNGGETSTVLGHWLADTFPNMYGGLEGTTNAGIAQTYQVLFKRTAKTSPGGPPKLDAQVMAVALATFVTKESLVSLRYVSPGEDPITDPALVAQVQSYGFVVTAGGVGSASFNVGQSGRAFGLADYTSAQIIDLLLATDGLSRDGLLYDDDAHGQAGHGEIDAFEALLRRLANDVYAAISQQGSI